MRPVLGRVAVAFRPRLARPFSTTIDQVAKLLENPPERVPSADCVAALEGLQPNSLVGEVPVMRRFLRHCAVSGLHISDDLVKAAAAPKLGMERAGDVLLCAAYCNSSSSAWLPLAEQVLKTAQEDPAGLGRASAAALVAGWATSTPSLTTTEAVSTLLATCSKDETTLCPETMFLLVTALTPPPTEKLTPRAESFLRTAVGESDAVADCLFPAQREVVATEEAEDAPAEQEAPEQEQVTGKKDPLQEVSESLAQLELQHNVRPMLVGPYSFPIVTAKKELVVCEGPEMNWTAGGRRQVTKWAWAHARVRGYKVFVVPQQQWERAVTEEQKRNVLTEMFKREAR
mmetsp:Transcript_45893/g.103993  ORF Transcript_45893/g.103993 Transcript_45893/m.103993 type:complete len:344 (+) Transcript_45893:28-1059(+)